MLSVSGHSFYVWPSFYLLERDRERETSPSTVSPNHPNHQVWASRKPGTLSRVSHVGDRDQVFDLSLAASQGHYQEAGWEAEVELAPSTLIWEAGTPSDGLTHAHTVP